MSLWSWKGLGDKDLTFLVSGPDLLSFSTKTVSEVILDPQLRIPDMQLILFLGKLVTTSNLEDS